MRFDRWRRAARLVGAAVPLAAQLRDYDRSWLPHDVTAGLAIAAVALPIAIAYPAIAGLPSVVGLYASILPLVAYAIFGSSRQLIVGPDAATLTVLAASLGQVAASGADPQRAVISGAFAIAVGLMCLLAAVLRLGFIANFLSRPILIGYLCGTSLTLLASQIGRLTTVQIKSTGFFRPLIELAGGMELVHVPSVALGIGIFLMLRLIRWWKRRLPGPLVAVVAGIALTWLFSLESSGVALLGEFSASLPHLTLPTLDDVELDDFVLDACGILIVSFGSGIVTARSFGAKNRYRVDANRELVGFGAANLLTGLFGGFPVTGADSRTAINDAVGGRTQVAGLVAAGVLTLVLVALTGVMKYLPIPVLGAIIASAALDLFDADGLWRLWKTNRPDFAFAVIAMAGVVGLGLLKGVLIAVVASVVYLLARVSRPRDALLGCIPGDGNVFHKLHREPRAKPLPGLAVYLVQGSLLFFNIDYIRDRIRWIARRLPPSTQWFVLDAEAVNTIDSTAADVLRELVEELATRNLRFAISNLHGQPREVLYRSGLLASIGSDMLFDRLEDIPQAFRLQLK